MEERHLAMVLCVGLSELGNLDEQLERRGHFKRLVMGMDMAC